LIIRFASPIWGEGQSSATGDLDGDVVGPDASSKTEESRNDGSETHIVGNGSRDFEPGGDQRWTDMYSMNTTYGARGALLVRRERRG